MDVRTEASVFVNAPPECVFDLATALSTLPQIFRGYGPIPAIESAQMADGGEMRAGAIRRVTNADGSVVEELMLTLARPNKQAYRLLRGFKPPFAWLIRAADSEWTFTPWRGGTRIVWRFRFVLTSPLAYPPLAFIARRYFSRAQSECLDRLRALAEDAALDTYCAPQSEAA